MPPGFSRNGKPGRRFLPHFPSPLLNAAIRGIRWPTNRRRCKANAMALDPEKAFLDYSAADCSVQFWTANAPAVQFTSLEAAVRFAKDHGGRWEEIEITVHLPREDIVFATGKVHQLIDALPGDLRKKR